MHTTQQVCEWSVLCQQSVSSIFSGADICNISQVRVNALKYAFTSYLVVTRLVYLEYLYLAYLSFSLFFTEIHILARLLLHILIWAFMSDVIVTKKVTK